MKFEASDRLAAVLRPLVEKQGGRAFGRSIGVSSGTVSRWLQGESFPDGDNRDKLSKALGMTMEQFNRVIVEGNSPSDEIDPVAPVLELIQTLPPSEVARILRAAADRLDGFDAYRSERAPSNPGDIRTLPYPMSRPVAADPSSEYQVEAHA
ncbi:helix-turn-helix domain-containing protein [Phormidium sp. FACHB-77]|nr:helix-turn-helix domain-containing protein [Phormidium sp. FACHB-77]